MEGEGGRNQRRRRKRSQRKSTTPEEAISEKAKKSKKNEAALVNRIRDVVNSREATNLEIKLLKEQVQDLKNEQPSTTKMRRKA